MTGTILSGRVDSGDNIEIAAIKQTKKVKSMQMFRKSVDKAKKGDRVGICVAKLDPKDLERGLV
jgi:selenocysteine-specific elongation factor